MTRGTIAGLLVGLLVARDAFGGPWLPVGQDKAGGQCFFLNTDRLSSDSFNGPTQAAVAWIQTTTAGMDISERELIRFDCAGGKYSALRGYIVTADGRARQRMGHQSQRIAVAGTPGATFLANVCKFVELSAEAIVQGQPKPVRLVQPYPDCAP